MGKLNSILAYLSRIEGYLSNNISPLITDVKHIQEHQTANLTYGEETDYVRNDGHDIVSDNLNQENISETIVEAPSNAAATGIEHEKMAFDENDNTIMGVANVVAISTSQANANSGNEANSKAIADANVFGEAVGIINQDKIATRRGNDTIIGFATTEATGTATALAQGKSASNNSSSTTANSESTVLINATAVGIDNEGDIITGTGNDIVVGVVSTMSMGNATASAFTQSISDLAHESDLSALNEIGIAMARSDANATTNNQSTTLGIINSGKILTGSGDDVIIGLAKNTSVVDTQTTAEAESTANNIARATAEADSLAIAEGFAVGIVNSNRINTGRGDDTVIGFAINDSTADAIADADAEANALDSNTQTNSNAIADASRAISLGIDNAEGLFITAKGDDQIVGIGTIGITGGNFKAGQGNDRVIGYGSAVGVEETTIGLGYGDDFFQASIVNIDLLTGGISFQDDQSTSIKNTDVFGGRGNDTFDLGRFEETVSIDGGRDHDALRLWGNLDDYQINQNSSDNNSIYIQDGDSILSVKNVESFYFGDQDQLYSFDELA